MEGKVAAKANPIDQEQGIGFDIESARSLAGAEHIGTMDSPGEHVRIWIRAGVKSSKPPRPCGMITAIPRRGRAVVYGPSRAMCRPAAGH